MSPSRESASNSQRYPFAGAPDIIRSHQKDAFFQSVVLEQLTNVLRRLRGARYVHAHASDLSLASSVFYLGLSTLVGNRTLGEEYCDIVQVESETSRLPSLRRRVTYILCSLLAPYALTKGLPRLRLLLRQRLSPPDDSLDNPSLRFRNYLCTHVDSITSPSPFYFASLVLFYFSGSYYHLSKRLLGLRYIFTRRLGVSERREGYEVLGVLLVLQMLLQTWLHLKQNLPAREKGSLVEKQGSDVSPQPSAGQDGQSSLKRDTASSRTAVSSLERALKDTLPTEPRYSLKSLATMPWIDGYQQRKCTLCLEEMRDPSATTCGHVFCWSCINDWCREKAECPLCRQTSFVQHILPLRT